MDYKCRDCGKEINEGEYKTFGVCDDCWDKAYPQNLPKANAYPLLADVRALLKKWENVKKTDMWGNESDWEIIEDFENQIKKVSEHFS